MYTRIDNIINTFVVMVERDIDKINNVIHIYEPQKNLTVFKGMRKSLPLSAFPSLEIEPTNANNQWATTRAQRPRYNLNCVLTVSNSNENVGVEYISSIIGVITEIVTDPSNLQLKVDNSVVFDPSYGQVETFITDSFVEDVTYNTTKDGTLRVAEFSWFALIHEPFPEFKWNYTDDPPPSNP